MDRRSIVRQLTEAEWHIAVGERHLAKQRGVLIELQKDGHDTALAERLVAVLEDTPALVFGRARPNELSSALPT